jgi:hypothetical protein
MYLLDIDLKSFQLYYQKHIQCFLNKCQPHYVICVLKTIQLIPCLPSQASSLNFWCKTTKYLSNPWCNNDLIDGKLYPHLMILIVTMIGTQLEIQDSSCSSFIRYSKWVWRWTQLTLGALVATNVDYSTICCVKQNIMAFSTPLDWLQT